MKTTLQKGRKYAVLIPIKGNYDALNEFADYLGIDAHYFVVEGISQVQFVESNGTNDKTVEPTQSVRCAAKYKTAGGNRRRCGRKTTNATGYCPFHRFENKSKGDWGMEVVE